MTSEEIINKIVYTIKNKRNKVEKFLLKHGKPIKKSDSNVLVGKMVGEVLYTGNQDVINEFSNIIESPDTSNAVGAVSLISQGIAGIFGSSSAQKQKELAAQQGSDAITLALINASIEKNKPKSNTLLIVGIVALVVVLVIIGILIYKKYNK